MRRERGETVSRPYRAGFAGGRSSRSGRSSPLAASRRRGAPLGPGRARRRRRRRSRRSIGPRGVALPKSASPRPRPRARSIGRPGPPGEPTRVNPSPLQRKETRMSALDTALDTIDAVAGEGDLAPARAVVDPLELGSASEPILLPDRRRIYPPRLHGQPIDELACALLDMDDPARSTFLRLIGPPGAGKSQIARAIGHRLWTERGRAVEERHGSPFYGFVELQPGPSSDEYFFRYDYVPLAGAGGQVTLVDSGFVQAMREGWVVMIDEVNTARDVCLLSINACLDGRLCLYLSATGETVRARPGFAVLLAYNPGLVGATDIPDAWHSRFPATLEVSSNWPALAALGAPATLVGEAMRLDHQRIAGEDGLTWTPQFRDVDALWQMIERIGERPALAFFASNLHEQVQAGKLQDAEAAAACRMLDQAGYAHLKVSATGGRPSLHGYPRAVTG